MHDFDEATRSALWARAASHVEGSFSAARALGTTLGKGELDALVAALDGEHASDPAVVLEHVARGLAGGQVQVAHPRYFGLLSAAPSSMALVVSMLAEAFDPQLATRRHAPFAVDVEERLLSSFGERFGWPRASSSGLFTGGGAEATLVATAAAIAHVHPAVRKGGLRALSGDPMVYVSAEGHPTVARAARISGLGARGVRVIPVDEQKRMRVPALRDAIGRDQSRGARPTLVVATVGTTSSGAIDPLREIADVAERAGAWLHVDAAWGGLLALVPEQRHHVDGIERAHSITFDPHKALGIPLGTGMLLTRRPEALAAAFHERAGYMPKGKALEPYARGIAWSRRPAGLPLAAVIATAGWEGIATTLRREIALGERLGAELTRAGFGLRHTTPLPVVAFTDPTREDGAGGAYLEGLARAAIADGAGWISVTRFADGSRALRACITNHRSREADVDALVTSLVKARDRSA